jgi:hypothetical protein
VAGYLAERGKQVEIFHKWMSIGSEIDRYSIAPVMTQLVERDVVIHTGMRLASVSDGTLELRSVFGGRTHVFEGFDTVVLVYGSVPDDRLYRDLMAESEAGSAGEAKTSSGDARLFLVGSAWVPRYLAEATQHGARVGMEI